MTEHTASSAPSPAGPLEQAWSELEACAARHRDASVLDLFATEPRRLERFAADAAGLRVDLSRNRIPDEGLDALLRLARAAGVEASRDAMLRGELVNVTEGRAALHTALRAPSGEPLIVDGADIRPAVRETLRRMSEFAEAVRSGSWRGATGRPISDVVAIGIGGSHLGPQLACEALAAFAHPRLKIHFLSNVDPAQWARIAPELNPATTLAVVASKSWRTQETARNAAAVRRWFVERGTPEGELRRHFVGVSANVEAAVAFGLAPESVFPFGDWVGGRFSLWSAIGLPVMLAVGPERFGEMLGGAHAMDRHFAQAPLERNAPMLLALVSQWNALAIGSGTEAVVPYCDALRRLPAYLQQLQMESNGKSVDASGAPVRRPTACVTWGEPGTDSQHSFFQALHQGTAAHPVDFVLCGGEADDPEGRAAGLLANAVAQAEALMRGRSAAEVRAASPGIAESLVPHRVHPGNRPSSTIWLPRLDPASFGALLALYEHKTAALGWLWGIDSFDQWGVELGKQMAARIEPALDPRVPLTAGLDPSTADLLRRIRDARSAR